MLYRITIYNVYGTCGIPQGANSHLVQPHKGFCILQGPNKDPYNQVSTLPWRRWTVLVQEALILDEPNHRPYTPIPGGFGHYVWPVICNRAPQPIQLNTTRFSKYLVNKTTYSSKVLVQENGNEKTSGRVMATATSDQDKSFKTVMEFLHSCRKWRPIHPRSCTHPYYWDYTINQKHVLMDVRDAILCPSPHHHPARLSTNI